jgi:hypothetical protein
MSCRRTDDIYNAWWWRFDAVLQPETRAAYQRLLEPGVGGCDTTPASSRAHLHLRGQRYGRFSPRCGLSHGLCAARARRSPRASRGAEVDKHHRGRDKPSDHAPVWVELQRVRAGRNEPCLDAAYTPSVQPLHEGIAMPNPSTQTRSSRAKAAPEPNALDLLENDHKQVKALFPQLRQARQSRGGPTTNVRPWPGRSAPC